MRETEMKVLCKTEKNPETDSYERDLRSEKLKRNDDN